MKLKRVSAAVLALAMTASTAALAAPADGARLPQGGYETTLSINGEALTYYEYTRDIPGTWESETVTVQLTDISPVAAGYVPMRAIAQADHGSASWFAEECQSWFYLGDIRIIVDFINMTVEVDGEALEGVEPILLNGVTYLPVSVIDGLEGFTVTDNSTDEGESYEIATPNGAPLMKLTYQLMDIARMGLGMKQSLEDFEAFYGEQLGFQADFTTEGLAYLPMMMSPDTLILGKVAEGKTEALQAALEEYRKAQYNSFEHYLVDNLPKIENAKFVTEGDWFLFLIAENADEAVEAFRAAVQAMDAE